MTKLSLVTSTVFFVTFLTYLQFSEAKPVEIKIDIQNLTSINASCHSRNKSTLTKKNGKFSYDCDCFFTRACCIDLKTDRDDQVTNITIHGSKIYVLEFVKSIRHLSFKYTENKGDVQWKLIVNTANTSKEVVGRIYFILNCYNNKRSIIPLANQFKNFEAGNSDEFNFSGPDLRNDNYCVSIFNTLSENWIMTSMILTQVSTNATYKFYHGEKTKREVYFGYKGRDFVSWTIEVTTGAFGMNFSAQIVLVHNDCETKLTLDTEADNYRPNSNDVFNVRAKNCNTSLQKIRIKPSWYFKWVLEKINATRDDGYSHTFYHNETLSGEQTFFVNQDSGVYVWFVSVCSENATDDEVYLQIHGHQATTDMIRLTTPADDFKAGQCSNFTLRVKDIGNLTMIEGKMPIQFKIERITLYNDDKEYEFKFPKSQYGIFKILYHKIEMEKTPQQLIWKKMQYLQSKNNFPMPKANRPEWKTQQQYILDQVNVLKPKANRSVWLLFIESKGQQSKIQVEFTYLDNSQVILTYPELKKSNIISTIFSVWSMAKLLNVKISSQKRCKDMELTMFYQWKRINLKSNAQCLWKNEENSRSSTRKNPTMHTRTMSITHLPPSSGSSSRSSSSSSSSSSSKSSSSSSSSSSSRIPEERRNCLECIPKNISKEQLAENLKTLTKELKLNRTETSHYLRSKTCAPDERTSSQVIGTVAAIVITIPFGMIILTDLIPLFNLIYRKIISLI